MSNGWIGVDLDGTLAQYDGWKGAGNIGDPVPAMLARVKKWLEEGRDVRIFTARVSHDGTVERAEQAREAHHAIQVWCRQHIGRQLLVTNVKDYSMVELWDDRAIRVLQNRGDPCCSDAEPGRVSVQQELLDRFPEINPSNYNHDDVCALNDWAIELVLSAKRGMK